MVSHPETGSDSPIGSDQDRGRDIAYARAGAVGIGRSTVSETMPPRPLY